MLALFKMFFFAKTMIYFSNHLINLLKNFMDSNFFNPEDAAKAIMTKSFLKSRGSLREEGSGSEFFQDNRIRSCSFIKEAKGGLKAVPFYDKRDNKIYPTQSEIRRSWTSMIHSNKGGEHAGGGMNKTLGMVTFT